MSLASRLTVLVTLAVVPSIGLTAYNTYRWAQVLADQGRAEALSTAQLVAAELQQFLDGSQRLMETLLRHPSAPSDPEGCNSYVKDVIARVPIYREFALIDRDGRFVCSSVPIPASLNVQDRLYFSEPLRTKRLTVGTLTRGRVTGRPSIHISAPLQKPEAGFDGIGALILNPEAIATEFGQRVWEPGRRVVVLDREGETLLRMPSTAADDASDLARQVFREAPGDVAGTRDVRGADGGTEFVGYVPVSMRPEGLFVAAFVDRSALSLRGTAWLNQAVLPGIVVLLLAIVGTWIAANLLLRRPLLAMRDAARRREAGDRTAKFPTIRQTSELGQLSEALRSMSDAVDQLLHQKDFLLRELQHRVMNSLTILTSLLALQSKHAGDPRVAAELTNAQKRIMAMANAYKFLYRAETTTEVDLADLLAAVCRDGAAAYGGSRHVALDLDLASVRVPVSQATALAVLVHELMTNTFKHAYGADEPAAIRLTLEALDAETLRLCYADRGRGMPDGFDAATSPSLGFKVVAAIARQYKGQVALERTEPGTAFVLVLKRAQDG